MLLFNEQQTSMIPRDIYDLQLQKLKKHKYTNKLWRNNTSITGY